MAKAKEPWSGILSVCSWAIQSLAHLVKGTTLGQRVFGRDMLFDVTFKRDWAKLQDQQQGAQKAAHAFKTPRESTAHWKWKSRYCLMEMSSNAN
jgi:hypothetical protein